MRYHWELLKVWRIERSLYKQERALVKELRAKKATDDEINEATNNYALDILECQEDREYLHHRRLREKAESYFISLLERTAKDFDKSGDVDSDKYWRSLSGTDRWVLRPKGIRQVRSEIREEQKARRDYWLGWFTPFANIISTVLAAVLGFLLGRAVVK